VCNFIFFSICNYKIFYFLISKIKKFFLKKWFFLVTKIFFLKLQKEFFFFITKIENKKIIYFYFYFLIRKLKKIQKCVHVSVDWVKIGLGAKIATESKLRGLEKSCLFRGQNHNFGKLKGLKV